MVVIFTVEVSSIFYGSNHLFYLYGAGMFILVPNMLLQT